MLLGFVIFYVPLAIIGILLLLYFQDLGLKLILLFLSIWLLSYWLIPQMMNLSRDLVWVMPGNTEVRLRATFAGVEGGIATVMFLVVKIRNWVM